MADDIHPASSSGADSASASNPYLTRPATCSSATSTSNTTKSTNKQPSKHETRLYVGNLHPTVDEYTLISTLSKFGKISKLDFLFHKSGPQRGQPRGYAFVEYSSPQEALQAVVGAHDKTLRGRKISVTFASKNEDGSAASNGGVGPQRRDRRTAENETTKTRQLSLNRQAKQPHGTDAKIAAMEAKLAKMRQAKAPPVQAAAGSLPKGAGIASLPAKPNFKPANETKRSTQQQRHS